MRFGTLIKFIDAQKIQVVKLKFYFYFYTFLAVGLKAKKANLTSKLS